MSIVVGYLTSPEGEAALETGLREAGVRDAKLLLVLSGTGVGQSAVDHEADELRDRLDAAEVTYEVRRLARSRDVADDILATAEETNAQLIIVGLRRRTAVGKLFLGSTAQRILLDATCPVLGVKPPGSTGRARR